MQIKRKLNYEQLLCDFPIFREAFTIYVIVEVRSSTKLKAISRSKSLVLISTTQNQILEGTFWPYQKGNYIIHMPMAIISASK